MATDQNYKVLVDALSRLQDVSVEKSVFNFPKIIAVGGQSSGKSSVIQGLIGREILPKGVDIVTRCPLHIRVHQTASEDEEYVKFPAEEKYKCEEETFQRMEDAMKEIDRRTDLRTKNTKNISAEKLLIDLYSPNFPDLQFIDLPGFTKTAVGNQAHDIEEQIQRVVLGYMEDPDSIILAIMDASQDIGSSEAIKFAEKVDPEGERTLGVFTKLDRLEDGSKAVTKKVVDYISNKTKPLKLGYIGVVNRTQKQIEQGVDIASAKATENSIMSKPDFKKIRDRLGIDTLRRFLTQILAKKMKDQLPMIRTQSIGELEYIEEQLKELGEEDGQEKGGLELIVLLVEDVMQKIRLELKGYDGNVETKCLSLGAEMNDTIKKETVRAAKRSREAYSVHSFHQELQTALANMYASQDPMMPVQLVLDKGIRMLIESYKSPFLTLLETACNKLNAGINEIAESKLQKYPRFKDLVATVLIEEIKGNKTKAKEYLEIFIDVNQRFINTEDRRFILATNIMGNGIRYPNNNNTWFQEHVKIDNDEHEEAIKTDDEESDSDTEDSNDSDVESCKTEASDPEILNNDEEKRKEKSPKVPKVSKINKKAVSGFTKDLQEKQKETKSVKYPIEMSQQSMMHVDLCLQYMKIMDEQFVDHVPKFLITMLIHRTLDFLEGGSAYGTSLLREVNSRMDSEGEIEKYLVKGHLHIERIKKLKNQKQYFEETIKIVEDTMENLNFEYFFGKI